MQAHSQAPKAQSPGGRCLLSPVFGLLFVLGSGVFWAPAQAAQEQHQHGPSREQYQIEPRRVVEGPVVDGVLDEAVWHDAAAIETFTQQEPAEGQPATERTQVLLLYDASSLYIGLRAYDADPTGIIATEMRLGAQSERPHACPRAGRRVRRGRLRPLAFPPGGPADRRGNGRCARHH